MYSLVLMMALGNGATPALVPDSGQAPAARYGNHAVTTVLYKHGCCGCGGCYGCYGCGGCHGCHGCHGCWGCYGGWGCCGGCYGGWGCCGGCYGGWGCCGGCYGGVVSYGGCYGCYGGGVIYGGGATQGTSGGSGDRGGSGRSGSGRGDRGGDRGDTGKEDSLESSRLAPAKFIVTLPADAKLTIDGAATKSTSTTRLFVSPPLEKGKSYVYTLEARADRDGKPVTVTKDITVRAGQETRVNLDFAAASVASK